MNQQTEIESAIHRLMVGVTKKDSDTCEWYEGIQHDGLQELVECGGITTGEADSYLEYCEGCSDMDAYPLFPESWRELNEIAA